jgi:hypothetical protein
MNFKEELENGNPYIDYDFKEELENGNPYMNFRKCGLNPYMEARSALVKLLFEKAKTIEKKLNLADSTKIIKKLEEDVKQKHKLYDNDKVEILKKALEHFKANVDKYLKD